LFGVTRTLYELIEHTCAEELIIMDILQTT
jgi:hypothetical protein